MNGETQIPSPARLYATVVGAILVAAGILGFFYEPSFAAGGGTRSDELLGILAVNGWQNLFYIASGLVALAMAGGNNSARLLCFAFGGIYLVLTAWTLAALDGGRGVLTELIPVNTADSFFYALLTVTAFAAALTSPSTDSARRVQTRRATKDRSPASRPDA